MLDMSRDGRMQMNFVFKDVGEVFAPRVHPLMHSVVADPRFGNRFTIESEPWFIHQMDRSEHTKEVDCTKVRTFE